MGVSAGGIVCVWYEAEMLQKYQCCQGGKSGEKFGLCARLVENVICWKSGKSPPRKIPTKKSV